MIEKSSAPSGQTDIVLIVTVLETPAQKRARLLRAWNSSRRKRFEKRLEFHRKRALNMGRPAEFLITDEVIENYILFENKCAYCQDSRRRVQIDHVKALSKGGTHSLNNIIPSCARCNRSKNSSAVKEWYRKQKFYTNDRWRLILSVIDRKRPRGK